MKLSLRCVLMIVALLGSRSDTRATDLFVDRHFQPDGSEVDRVFQTNASETAKTIDENHAGKLAADWVTSHYLASNVRILTTTLQVTPVRFWIIRISGNVSGQRDLFYSVVLATGKIVEPKVVHRQTDVSQLGETLEKSSPKLEIHGEMDFEFATGKGLGSSRPGFGRARPSQNHEPFNSDGLNSSNP
jgi:hypothetical protein